MPQTEAYIIYKKMLFKRKLLGYQDILLTKLAQMCSLLDKLEFFWKLVRKQKAIWNMKSFIKINTFFRNHILTNILVMDHTSPHTMITHNQDIH